MNDFNAKAARELVSSHYSNEIDNILSSIKEKAEVGETVLHVYEPLNSKTITELRNRGFKVTEIDMLGIQRDSLYYSIYWE